MRPLSYLMPEHATASTPTTESMPHLTNSDLLPLEAYVMERLAFEAGVIAHLKARTIRLGERAVLQFQDQITARYRAQEWVRYTQQFEAAKIQSALDGYSALIPNGCNLKGTMLFEFADGEQRAGELARLAGIEQNVYAEIEGQGRSFAIAEEILPRCSDETRSKSLLRFEFSAEQIAYVRAGADFGFGINDDRMRVAHTLKRHQRAALLADFA